MLLNEEEKQPGQFPVERRVKTDTLCLHFSWPLFFMILQIFLFVIICGRSFSFLHPADSNGLRCGIDNSLFYPNLSDFSDHRYLTFQSKCSNECEGIKYFSFCIPTERKKLSKSPLSFRIINDTFEYRYFGLLMIIITFIFSFPIYFIFAKFSLYITYFLLFSVTGSVVFIVAKSLLNHFYLFAVEVLCFGISYLFVLLYIKRRIHVIGPIVTTSFKFLMKSKDIFLAPILILLFSLIIFSFIVFGVLFSNGVAQPIVSSSGLLSGSYLQLHQHFSLLITKLLFPFLGIWIIEFVFVLTRFAVSFITASLYFKHPKVSFIKALQIGLKYHAGTIFFGSFVVFLLEFLSTLFMAMKKWLKKTKNSFVRFLCRCILNLCFLLVKFVGEINRLSFVYTAVEGVSFWDGCKKASKSFQIDSVLSITLLLNNILFGARILIASIVAILTYKYIDGLGLMKPVIPVIVVPLLVYFTLSAIDLVIAASSQTLLVCMIEDARDDGSYAPFELQNIMNWMKERVGRVNFSI
ncbi:hypothetical protein TRFO_30088 [Tritrichomonas foetus]|uniref:Choline transporter-like protein n=1 Tax=Tritrichomonas foetus TaxID=1144522 RepID=A0A1J4JUP6_9EUKA|nr:hypothetical protein TRFO_30088 [Tritrichomonas foetus]|eukprot:OHT02723.1 hypothetical protein TRFO_30088 [Tritrichomonas foetus]